MKNNIAINFFCSFMIEDFFIKHYFFISNLENIEKIKRQLFLASKYGLVMLHLKEWQISKQINSLIKVHYAQIKRNPE
jgi:hypothetical protein